MGNVEFRIEMMEVSCLRTRRIAIVTCGTMQTFCGEGHIVRVVVKLVDLYSKTVKYGYIVSGRFVTHKNEKFSILGQIHTHQDKNEYASPSFYTGDGYGDLGFSASNSKLPVFTMGWDGKLYGIYGEYRKNGNAPLLTPLHLHAKDASLFNLLNGTSTLTSIIRRMKK